MNELGLNLHSEGMAVHSDVWYEILKHQPHSALIRMSQVCSSWKELCNEMAWKPFVEERGLTGFTCPLQTCSEYVRDYNALFFQICPSFRNKDKNNHKDFLYENRQGIVNTPGINIFEVKEIIDGCFEGTMNPIVLTENRWGGDFRVPFLQALDANNTRMMTMLLEMGAKSSPAICEYALKKFGTGPNGDRPSFAEVSPEMFRMLLKGIEPSKEIVDAIATTGRIELKKIALEEWPKDVEILEPLLETAEKLDEVMK